jgi:hypothetical protein
MQSTFKYEQSVRIIRRWLIFFMISLFFSGLTAMPVEKELAFVSRWFSPQTTIGAWLDRVYVSITAINDQYPFISYGFDWLAFAHFVLAILFIGPYKNPVRNKWVIEFGIIACILIIPFALIAGEFRGIPFNWRLIDCSFGIVGLIPLLMVYQKVTAIEQIEESFKKAKTMEP